MPTIGQKLGDARRDQGLSVEDVAHETRIHPNMIVRIEDDDFSQFPSVAYAKSFIRKYSDHLGIDIAAAMAALNSGVTVRLSENDLMGEMTQTIKKDRRFRLERRSKGQRTRSDKPGGAPVFLNVILFALMASLGVFYFLGFNASTPEEAKAEITRGLQKANPFSESPAKDPADREALAPGGIAGTPGADPTGEDAEALAFPGHPLAKPEVKLPFEDALASGPALPAAPGAGNPPRPRDTPGVVFAEEALPPVNSADLSAARRPIPEPQAVLRPEGTDPAAMRREEEVARPKPAPGGGNLGGGTTSPAPALRAVPVAASEG